MTITKRMILFCLALAAAGSLSAAGQELEVVASRLDIGAQMLYGSETTSPAHMTAFSLRYGHDLAMYGPTCLQLQATLQAPATATFPVDTHSIYLFSAPVSFTQEGCAVGLQARWHHGAEFGLGSELRLEHLTDGDVSANQVRPWLTARLGWGLPVSDGTFLVGLDGAWALTHARRDGSWMLNDNNQPVYALTAGANLLRLAPNSGFSLYLGARF